MEISDDLIVMSTSSFSDLENGVCIWWKETCLNILLSIPTTIIRKEICHNMAMLVWWQLKRHTTPFPWKLRGHYQFGLTTRCPPSTYILYRTNHFLIRHFFQASDSLWLTKFSVWKLTLENLSKKAIKSSDNPQTFLCKHILIEDMQVEEAMTGILFSHIHVRLAARMNFGFI